MTLYRAGIDMLKKYEKKYNPTVIGTRFSDVQPVALERAQEGLITIAAIRDLVRPILDAYGVTATQRAAYLGFALKLAKHVMRHKGEAAKKFAAGLKAFYVSALDLDPTILDEIIDVVVGWAAPY